MPFLAALALLSAITLLALAAAPALAQEVAPGGSQDAAREVQWRDWWLPDDFSAHGDAIDNLFLWIFWITTVAFFLVEVTLVVFLIKYRARPEKKKAIFTHGNTRLEMAWTLAPAVILLLLALFTKRVWDTYRFGNASEEADRRTVLVVGEQFAWNVAYPGPDNKLGRYMAFPKTTDARFAHLMPDEATRQVQAEISANPLGFVDPGKNREDPGFDDDYARRGSVRPLFIPVNTPIQIHLTAKDVIHDFFLPNFRVKLDAVPGMRGLIHFTAVQRSTVGPVPLDEVPDDRMIWLSQKVQGAVLTGLPPTWRIYDPRDVTAAKGNPRALAGKGPWLSNLGTIQEGAENRLLRREAEAAKKGSTKGKKAQPRFKKREDIPQEELVAEVESLRQDLQRLGVTELTYVERPFEIICEELCGSGHSTMRSIMIVLDTTEYDDFLNKVNLGAPSPGQPARQPPPTTAEAPPPPDTPAEAGRERADGSAVGPTGASG